MNRGYQEVGEGEEQAFYFWQEGAVSIAAAAGETAALRQDPEVSHSGPASTESCSPFDTRRHPAGYHASISSEQASGKGSGEISWQLFNT